MTGQILENQYQQGRVFNVRISLIVAFLLISINIPLYSDIFSHSFVRYDDYSMIVDRIDTYDGLNFENLKKIVLEDYPREEPLILRDISYLVNSSIFGPLNPKGYLLGNLFLHLLVSYCVYLLALQIFPRQYMLAILSAVFFSLHPMHVESIAWISSRKDPLYAFFFLSAFLVYIKSFSERKIRYYIISLFFFICALFSKSSAIAFLPALICFRISIKRTEKITMQEIIFIAGALIATFLFINWYTGILAEYGVIRTKLSANRDWGYWVLSGLTYIVFYIEKLFLPVDLSLLYDYPAAPNLFSKRFYVLSSVILFAGGLSCLAILWRRKSNEIVFLGLFFICALLPYLDLARVNIYVANRYVYLASSAFCILIAYGIIKAYVILGIYPKLYRILFATSVCVYCAFLGYQTIQAIKPWENTLALWQNAIKLAPKMPDTYSGVMVEYLLYYIDNPQDENAKNALNESKAVGENAVAKFCYNSLDRCPEQLNKIIFDLGQIYLLEGKSQLAEEYFKASLRLNPRNYLGRYIYARLLISQNKIEQAKEHIKYIELNANPNINKNLLRDIKMIVWPSS